MPQMDPMLWSLLTLIPFLSMLSIFIKSYYFQNINLPPQKKVLTKSINKKKWSW